ncbi:unnamed protein product [Clonostachys chloroleuca]|uniref:Uncharacterized protein n=1 Tax=Clonostachys chloroleuca TaxID=1926264 RepID=A0AA35MH73_9HYPO|nr:unnamed protein product [Clonostachys chloroleuca]
MYRESRYGAGTPTQMGDLRVASVIGADSGLISNLETGYLWVISPNNGRILSKVGYLLAD